jgi:hypothetical protein
VYRLLIGSIALIGLMGCAAPPLGPAPLQSDVPHIYVVRREGHTGIAVEAARWPTREWSLLADFPAARFLEFGRGDAIYYQAREKTLTMTLGAGLWPSPSVIEVLASPELDQLPTRGYDIVPIRVTPQQLQAVADSIAQSFSASTPIPTGTQWTTAAGESRFYQARGSFHLLRLCNRWTVEQLRAAGCERARGPVLFASQVLRAARRCQATQRMQAAPE